MRVLLDTNIIIHREASNVVIPNIGTLFKWLDHLKYEKCIHPLTIVELQRYADIKAVNSMTIKVDSYVTLKTEAPLDEKVKTVSKNLDKTENDLNDSKILNELYSNRVDILISEDKKMHVKANMLGLSDKIFKIHQFLEKVISENPELIEYKILSIKKAYFGEVNLKDKFFDSFREDYKGFDKWFNKKSDESAYICYNNQSLSAFLYIKIEDPKENYSDISPQFANKKRLKIGTLKVTSNGIKIGERFLKIVFDNALLYKVDEIYVTLFDKRPGQKKLIQLLENWGLFIMVTNLMKMETKKSTYVRSIRKRMLILRTLKGHSLFYRNLQMCLLFLYILNIIQSYYQILS